LQHELNNENKFICANFIHILYFALEGEAGL